MARIAAFTTSTDKRAAVQFHDSRDKQWPNAKSVPFSETHIKEIAYRPLDQRFLYNHKAYGDFLRPELQEVWGKANYALYSLPLGTGGGPAVWCHGALPDYHAFRGSYGGYAFPLLDRRPGEGPYNLRPELMEALGAAYGGAVTADAVFDVILALLSASSYTTRFAEDLEDVFPHVPLPTDPNLFAELAAAGARIRAVETFSAKPDAKFSRGLAQAQTPPTGPLAPVEWTDGSIRLCADGSGVISNIPLPVWEFAVSGYRVLPRWLAGREGLPIEAGFIPELRDVAARIAELIDLFAGADSLLERTLDQPLSRAALGFDSVESASDGE